jgi:hypothetical protein
MVCEISYDVYSVDKKNNKKTGEIMKKLILLMLIVINSFAYTNAKYTCVIDRLLYDDGHEVKASNKMRKDNVLSFVKRDHVIIDNDDVNFNYKQSSDEIDYYMDKDNNIIAIKDNDEQYIFAIIVFDELDFMIRFACEVFPLH